MKEILFRAKRKDSGEWVYGFYTCVDELCFISLSRTYIDKVKVDPKTVGQYIGINDKDGKKIFEGDLIRDIHNSYRNGFGTVEWLDDMCAFGIAYKNYDSIDIYTFNGLLRAGNRNKFAVMVVGNIYDNSELLEAKE